MWIDCIKMKNFRQYQDEKVEFPEPKNGKNFVVIKGTTGAGKSNLLNAITWCLYGKEYHLGTKNAEYKKLNKITKKKMKIDDKAKVEVEIQFRDDKDRIVVIRELDFKKINENEVEEIPSPFADSNADDGSIIKVLRSIPGKGMVGVGTIAIDTTIPEILREYFFFDGEHLNDYFEENSPKSIKEAVFKISQLEILDMTISNIERVKSEIQRKAKNISFGAKEKQELIDTRKHSLNEFKSELDGLREKRKDAELGEKEYSNKLRSFGGLDVKKLSKDRDEKQEEIEKLQSQLKELNEDKLDFLLENAPIIFSFNAIEKTRKLLDEKEESGEIPPDHKRNFLERILERGECICGCKLTKGGTNAKNIEKALDKCSEITNISEELCEESGNMRRLQRKLNSFSEVIKDFNSKISGLVSQIKTLSEKKEEIGRKIAGLDEEKFARWENKRAEYEKEKIKLSEEIGNHEARIEEETKNIQRLDRELEDELKREDQGKKLNKELEFCRDALLVAERIKEDIMEEMRKEIEKKTQEQFLQLIWKEKNFTKVLIDDDYRVEAIDQEGRNALAGGMSAGERQALALSFMAALNTVSGFEAPIVIDTPLGRIDEKPKQQIAEKLPNYLKGKQVIMLMTSSEFSTGVQQKLSKSIGKKFEIKFTESEMGQKANVI